MVVTRVMMYTYDEISRLNDYFFLHVIDVAFFAVEIDSFLASSFTESDK